VTDGTTTTKIGVCPASELTPGQMRLVEHEGRKIGVFNCDGTLYAIEDRCSHDDGPLAEGEFDQASCTVECPRHGSLFDLSTGRPKTLPAFAPVQTFATDVVDDTIVLEVE
jgi:3-phenylpropionate/trans-cinnamate dioxygenase ferredoxin subunit